MRIRIAPFVAPLALLALSLPAHAVGTRRFELNTLDELSGGDLKGVSVRGDGVVVAGWTLGNTPLPEASAVFCALPLADGSTLLGTSPGGRVFKVAGDHASVFAETKELAVTSLAQDKAGAIYAATIPGGKIFKVAQGRAELFTTLPETEDVWAIVPDKARTGLFAAVNDGRIFQIPVGGQPTVFFKTDEPHIVSLALAENGDLYAGSSGKALVYRVTGPGRASVLYDMPGDEVKAVALGPRGLVYAIANEYTTETSEPPRRPPAGRSPAAPSTPSSKRPGKGSLYRFDPQGRPERLMHHDDFHYMALALDAAGTPYVGTGAEGRVYSVDDAHVVTLVADTDERQVGALVPATPGRTGAQAGHPFIASSDPAVFHRVVAQGGADAIWTSKPLDAGLRARFGHLGWHATGPVEISTRTGETQTPDNTWSAWSNAVAPGGVVTSPSARFVQVRARWARDAAATLSQVTLPFQTENTRPVVTEVTARQRGGERESKEGIAASGGEPPKHDSVVRMSWKVDNTDNDPLRYRIAFKREGQTVWRDVLRPDEVLTKTEYDWDTAALPEGTYRVRVEASDEQANPPDQTQKHALESAPLLVDNTPPVFQGLTVAKRRLKGRVVDGVGPIVRVEIAVDGRLEWRPVGAADGLFDTRDEALDADISALVPPGPHVIAVRAFDAAGNSVIQDVEAP